MISTQFPDLIQAIRETSTHVVGYEDVVNQAQADVGSALLKAYDDPNAFIYFEAAAVDDIERPGDVIVCHPDVGVLVVEVKAYSINFIRRVEGNKLVVKYGNQPLPSRVNPIQQVQLVLYSIQAKTKHELLYNNIQQRPLFTAVVAMPNITVSEWRGAGYDRSFPSELFLFKEHFADSSRLTRRLAKLTEKNLAKARLPEPLMPQHLAPIKRALGDSDAINKARPPREDITEKSLGARLDELLKIEKHISDEQRRVAALPINGHPRLIRGVAGSGKTIVLSRMVARYLANQLAKPRHMFEDDVSELRVAVVCFNRALVPMLQERITRDYEALTHGAELKNENTLFVSHFNGLMERHAHREHENATSEQVMRYIKIYKDMKDNDVRAGAYRQQLKHVALPHRYDAIFVDEAQDLAPTEYQLLLDMLKPDEHTGEKNLIIFYDDAQNLYGRGKPVWKDLGIDVARGDRAQRMKVCYRNPQEVVELGYNVLLGSQAPEDVRVQTRQYAEINDLIKQNLVKDLGDHIQINFTQRNFHKPKVRGFATRQEEIEYVIDGLKSLIVKQNVRPEDILILFPSKDQFKDLPERIEAALPIGTIEGFVCVYKKNERDDDVFRPGHLTISTVHSAKGYDAQVVLVMGADLFKDNTKGRAALYVGVTRAIMLLYLTGVQTEKPSLLDEALKVSEML